jgi:hypothetical protein
MAGGPVTAGFCRVKIVTGPCDVIAPQFGQSLALSLACEPCPRDIAFLAADGTAQWIVYPTPFNPVARPAVELDATFRKSFTVTSPEPHAALSVRMFRTGVVTVNGEPLAPASSLHGGYADRLTAATARSTR